MHPTPPALDRRAFIGALVLAHLAPNWQNRGPFETVAEARNRLAHAALAIADSYLKVLDDSADGDTPPLGVPCPNQAPLDPPF